MESTAGIPATDQWANFLRNDEIDPGRLSEQERAIRNRSECPEFGKGRWEVIGARDPTVLALRYVSGGGAVMAIHNLAADRRRIALGRAARAYGATRELFGSRRYEDEGAATLEPDLYGYRWLRFEARPVRFRPSRGSKAHDGPAWLRAVRAMLQQLPANICSGVHALAVDRLAIGPAGRRQPRPLSGGPPKFFSLAMGAESYSVGTEGRSSNTWNTAFRSTIARRTSSSVDSPCSLARPTA